MSTEVAATGSLQVTPLGHLLSHLLDRRGSGTVVLEEASGEKHAVWLDAGSPAKAKVATRTVSLGQVLVEQRAITREIYERTLERALHERRLHGQVLLESGAIDGSTLREALREQLVRQVLWLFRLPPTTYYGYYDQVNFLECWGGPWGLPPRPLALIWRGLRRHARVADVEALTAGLGERLIELHVDAPLREFEFGPPEQALIDVLRAKPQPLSALVACGLAAPDEVRRLVYVLLLLRQLELGTADSRPVGVDPAVPSGRPSRVTAAPRFTPSALPAGVSSAPASQRRSAIPQPQRSVRISTPAETRPPSLSGEAAQVQKALHASTAFQKAEVLLRRGSVAEAEREALIATEEDPTQVDYLALRVWIQAHKPGAKLGDLLGELQQVIKRDDANLRARWYRGQLLQRLGRPREALHDFRFIVERDPRNTDALREVRLYAMRRSSTPARPSHNPANPQASSPPSGSSQGLLGKLFKKP